MYRYNVLKNIKIVAFSSFQSPKALGDRLAHLGLCGKIVLKWFF
jgi:hypothetical protein